MTAPRFITAGDVDPFIRPLFKSGNWYIPEKCAFTAGVAATANLIKIFPRVIRRGLAVNGLAIRVNTLSAGGNGQAAAYAADPTTLLPTGLPLISTGNLSTAAAGNPSQTGLSYQFTDGQLVWWATNADNATAVFGSNPSTDGTTSELLGSTTLNVSMQNASGLQGLTVSQTFGTWPDLTSASFTESISPMPIVQFKAA